MQPIQAVRHAEGECKAVGRYAQHYNAVANHYYMKELKIEHIEKPKGISNSPCHIIPYLPMGGVFFDSRHWTYGYTDNILPFAVTTRISANNQQFLKIMDNKINLPEELKGKKFRIRKLTPRECFRLMGVDDADIDKLQAFPYHSLIEHPAYSKEDRFRGMTEKEKRAAMKHSICDSAQYKLAGNSIVVDVLYHIFRKMLIETQNEDTQPTLF